MAGLFEDLAAGARKVAQEVAGTVQDGPRPSCPPDTHIWHYFGDIAECLTCGARQAVGVLSNIGEVPNVLTNVINLVARHEALLSGVGGAVGDPAIASQIATALADVRNVVSTHAGSISALASRLASIESFIAELRGTPADAGTTTKPGA